MALNNRQPKKPARRKTIKAHKLPTQQTENETDEENCVPLAAKDSGWVDLRFHNASYSQINGDTDADDEVTIEICEGESSSRQQSPMALLFPNVSEADLTRKTSPTAITKLLVGQKVNLKYLKNHKKHAHAHFSQDLPPLVETSSETAPENPE